MRLLYIGLFCCSLSGLVLSVTPEQRQANQDAQAYANEQGVVVRGSVGSATTDDIPQFDPNPPETSYYSDPSSMQQDAADQLTTTVQGQT